MATYEEQRDANILNWLKENYENPQVILSGMTQYEITPEDFARDRCAYPRRLQGWPRSMWRVRDRYKHCPP